MDKIPKIAPLAILFITLALLAFIASNYPRITLDSPLDLLIEAAYVSVCVYLLFKFKGLKESRRIYRTLTLSTSLLIIGSSIDLIDEFFEVPNPIDITEDICKSVGFLLFVIACVRWVDYHRKQLSQMQHLAEVDSLTGVSNRRAFLKLTEEYFDLNDKDTEHVSVLVIDVDHFKNINDSYGHQFGDKVLVNIANAIKLVLRKGDYVARIGGEEFVVLLKETDEKQATFVAEKIRASVQRTEIFHEQQNIKCTVSIGISSSQKDSFEFDNLFNKADQALYQAKSKGRNCWCTHSEESHD